MADVEVGKPVPAVTLARDGGGDLDLGSLRGTKVVLYFYPKDDTSGCTREAIDFSEMVDDFAAAGAVVVAVSKDSVASHDKFRDKHGLKVALLSDAEGALCEAFGVWIEKSMYGRKYMGIDRATFLIDGDGILQREWRKVKVSGHAAEVLAAARAL